MAVKTVARDKFKQYFVITIPKIIIFVFLLIGGILFLYTDTGSLFSPNYYMFVMFAIPMFFTMWYMMIVSETKKILNQPYIFALGFYIYSFYLAYYLMQIIFINNWAGYYWIHLLFTIQFARIAERLIKGGFPLFSFIFQFMVIYLVLHELSVNYLPYLYFGTQMIEDRFELKYKFFRLDESKYYSFIIMGAYIVIIFMMLSLA